MVIRRAIMKLVSVLSPLFNASRRCRPFACESPMPWTLALAFLSSVRYLETSSACGGRWISRERPMPFSRGAYRVARAQGCFRYLGRRYKWQQCDPNPKARQRRSSSQKCGIRHYAPQIFASERAEAAWILELRRPIPVPISNVPPRFPVENVGNSPLIHIVATTNLPLRNSANASDCPHIILGKFGSWAHFTVEVWHN